jgi:hypothetical protein
MSRSDRRSDRVGQNAPGDSDIRLPQPNSAPESMAIPMSIPVRQLGSPEGSVRRVSRAHRQVLERGLSEREWAILRDIDRFRFLTTKQIARMHFTHINTAASATRICSRVLEFLYGHRLVDHLDRRVGGIRAGSASYVWMVGPVGERLLRADAEVRIRRKEPSLHFMQHCLAIADCAIALNVAASDRHFELQTVETEPTCWRRYLSRSGATETLKPDLRVVTIQGDYEDTWFIEVDRATESIPTLVKQCRQYLAYRQTGQEQADHEVFPAVLWVLPDDRRLQRLHDALAAARGFDSSIFRLTTNDGLAEAVAGGAA